MFIVSLTYKCSLEKVDEYNCKHSDYLRKEFSESFIAVGEKEPRTGCVFLLNLKEREVLDSVIKKDPFYINNMADFEIIQFNPSMWVGEFHRFFHYPSCTP